MAFGKSKDHRAEEIKAAKKTLRQKPPRGYMANDEQRRQWQLDQQRARQAAARAKK